MTRYLPGAPRGGAMLICAALAGACAAPGAAPVRPEAYVATFDQANTAGLAVLDAVAPSLAPGPAAPYAAVLGPARMDAGSCEGRYAAAALQARCAALAAILSYNEALRAEIAGIDSGPFRRIAARYLKVLTGGPGPLAFGAGPIRAAERLARDVAAASRLSEGAPAIRALIAALRDDAPRIYEVERAARATRLLAEDHRFLAAMDDVFDAVNGRSSPRGPEARAALDRLNQRIAALLAREAPAYGAETIFDVMAQAGAGLSGAEVAALAPAIGRAEAAAADFDAVAAEWRDVAEAIRAYDALLAEVDRTLGGGGAAATIALHDRANDILRVLRRVKREVKK